MTQDLHGWASDLTELHAQVWTRLVRGVRDRRAPCRHPTLATVTPEGRPQARTVVLRAANKAAGTLHIYTDLNAAKVRDVLATPFAAVHIWDASAHLQLRIDAQVSILEGPQVAAIWEGMAAPSRLSYGCTPLTGQAISGALDYEKTSDEAAFVVLQLEVTTIDALHLGPDHRRARFDRDTGWAGTWLAP